MRPLVTLAFLALSSTAAHAAAERALRVDDTVYLQAGAHIGALHDGAVYGGALTGIQGAVGLRLTPDLSLRVSANGSAEAVGNGRTVSGLAAGLSWFLLDWTAVTANLRYRALADSTSLVERVFGEDDLCMGPCQATWGNVHSRDLGVELAIESTLQWSTLTVGIEWLSLHQPLMLLGAERHIYDSGRRAWRVESAEGLTAADLPWDIRYLSVNLGAAF